MILEFTDGRMIHTFNVESVPPEVGWEDNYEIVDEDTVVAGDTGDLYIKYTYSIDGDQLVLDMVRDDLPKVSRRSSPARSTPKR